MSSDAMCIGLLCITRTLPYAYFNDWWSQFADDTVLNYMYDSFISSHLNVEHTLAGIMRFRTVMPRVSVYSFIQFSCAFVKFIFFRFDDF